MSVLPDSRGGGRLTRHADAEPFVTKDGSVIRELMHPARHGNEAQSLAEATVAPGEGTVRHYHKESEELYHVTSGSGEVILGDAVHPLAVGDTVLIPPGLPHALRNTGTTALKVLCASSPPYSHEDTVLLE